MFSVIPGLRCGGAASDQRLEKLPQRTVMMPDGAQVDMPESEGKLKDDGYQG